MADLNAFAENSQNSELKLRNFPLMRNKNDQNLEICLCFEVYSKLSGICN